MRTAPETRLREPRIGLEMSCEILADDSIQRCDLRAADDAQLLHHDAVRGPLTRSLRDIGYDFGSAIADLVDNRIAANASEVRQGIAGSSRVRTNDAAKVLFERMNIVVADAASDGVWSFLSLVLLPDIAFCLAFPQPA